MKFSPRSIELAAPLSAAPLPTCALFLHYRFPSLLFDVESCIIQRSFGLALFHLSLSLSFFPSSCTSEQIPALIPCNPFLSISLSLSFLFSSMLWTSQHFIIPCNYFIEQGFQNMRAIISWVIGSGKEDFHWANPFQGAAAGSAGFHEPDTMRATPAMNYAVPQEQHKLYTHPRPQLLSTAGSERRF